MLKNYNQEQVQCYIDKLMAKMAIPDWLKEDACQEAWVAALEDKDVERHIKAFVARECKYMRQKKGSL